MLFLGLKTEKEWIKSAAETPVFGHFFVFALIFIPPAICSFIAQALIPFLHDDVGFTKAMLLLLPSWNLILWFLKVRLFIFLMPAWLLLGIIAIIKAITGSF